MSTAYLHYGLVADEDKESLLRKGMAFFAKRQLVVQMHPELESKTPDYFYWYGDRRLFLPVLFSISH